MVHFQETANALRMLSIDAVEAANSGHPGMPLGMADVATVLWRCFLKHNPLNPSWFNRDRFVLSNGHGSMLLYALLHLSGYKLSLDDLKSFRKLHSKTPGHPEVFEAPGVETTTGPLAQGLGNAVGMAIAEKILTTRFNEPDLPLVSHHTYAFVGDGCLMEGLSHEVCSLAGTLKLGKLIVFYDDNGISIDGELKDWFSDDTIKRFQAYDWQVIGPIDGHSELEIESAIKAAKIEEDKPTLIICKTIIGFASPDAGTAKVHGAPLGEAHVLKVREALNWPWPPFEIPQEIADSWNHQKAGSDEENEWHELCEQYKKRNPEKYHSFLREITGDLPYNFLNDVNVFLADCKKDTKSRATRKCSKMCLDVLMKGLPELLGGSADLSESNSTISDVTKSITVDDFSGNYLHYGVREFGMAAIMNGLALHGGFIPYGGTFLVFSDYARNAIRLSALMRQRVIYILTHDSIGLGEDGPTHQPIEHAAMLRMTPNLNVWRPADLLETAVSWEQSLLSRHAPSALLLSRQELPSLNHCSRDIEMIRRGGYILLDCEGTPDLILIATGSEVQLALSVSENVRNELGLAVRVVSMPCCERFLMQDDDYQEHVLPSSVRRRVAIEALSSLYWYRFIGLDGLVIGMERFGASGKAQDVFDYFGFSQEKVFARIQLFLSKKEERTCIHVVGEVP